MVGGSGPEVAVNTTNCSATGQGCDGAGAGTGSQGKTDPASIEDYVRQNLDYLIESSDPAATMQTLAIFAANINYVGGSSESLSARSTLMAILDGAWIKAANPAPKMALQTLQVALDIAGPNMELERRSLKGFQDLIVAVGTSVVKHFRGREASHQAVIVAEAQEVANLMSKAFGMLIQKSSWMSRMDSPHIQPPSSSQMRIVRREVDILEDVMRPKLRAASMASDSYFSMMSTLEGLDLISALSVANLAAGDTPKLQQSSEFKMITSVVATHEVQRYNASLDTRVADEPCLSAVDIAECCRSTGTCCIAGQCGGNWEGIHVDFGSTLLLPAGLRRLNAPAYEVELGTIKGNPFGAFDPRITLSDVKRLKIREFHSAVGYYDFGTGYGNLDTKPKAVLRLPISEKTANDLAEFDETTVIQQGRVAACVFWDAVARKWGVQGISQAPGAEATRKVCWRRGQPPVIECSHFVECTTTHLSYFTVADVPLDCEGVALGQTKFDHCDVCGGDNTTCSGCDGVPNSFQDGKRLDRFCSGHGSCRGGSRCACCADNLHKVSLKEGNDQKSQISVCPWYGIMCHRFCTRSQYEGPEASSAAQKIHCSGHGSCVDPQQGGPLECECDPGWTSKNDKLCGYMIPKVYVVKFSGKVHLHFPVLKCKWRACSRKH
jgi:hypothetical protein